ncbi:hypothetical protein J3458_000387 [Metarhizium acridum]|uniref:Uncharacterized protein n=1 Tax=Metarhizium acridum (strain CQMa 102) TaxID=655827 RepID=E9EEH0_METAQ|nr:uncharacterized protein MAC_08268 [Metarhizium acridum CQMa 102]EFY85677.1 hypothetical protein MAC_08268 [Metarhizium acridum CQMa 102]KAG8423499.1 hypothetical protein J3458_000387 [Metarhizium acridum]
MVSASSTESVSSGHARRTVYPAGRMKTTDYMYSIWPIPRNPSWIMRFMFYITGAPMAATHMVGKFPRSRIDETYYVYDPQQMMYTEQGAYVYWATTRGTYDLFRYWGVANTYYTKEAADAELASVVEEAAGARSPGKEPTSNEQEA